MTAVRTPDGRWQVVAGGSVLAGPFETSADAWRWIDRNSGDPISKGEQTADWAWNKGVHGE